MTPFRTRPRRRIARPARVLLMALAFAVCLVPACQDGEVARTQVCQFQCDYTDANARLSVQDVVQVIANALWEARANGVPDITVVVLDHLSNVLAVFDSDATTTNYSLITSLGEPNRTANTPFIVENNGGSADFRTSGVATANGIAALDTALDGIYIPAGYAAISKAGTSNYFSTQGNAFSSRTASVLIQQNFFPGETDRPGGPLFAVQIAQLVCSDVNTRQSVNQVTATTVAPDPTDLIGPRRLPVGFAADPGGLPLYKDGIPELDALGNPTGRTGKVVVGAVGVEFNGIYGLDKNALDADRNLEERIAWGATRTFEADPERRAPRITVAGKALRFADDTQLRSSEAGRPIVSAADVASPAAILTRLNGISGEVGAFVNDQFYFPFNTPRQGVNFLDPTSGVIAATIQAPAGARFANARGEILVDLNGNPRFLAAAGPPNTFQGLASQNPLPAAGGLTADEVSELLVEALRLAENTRAQTRTPLGGQARIDVAVVDLDGNVIGFARSQDALLDGVDVTIAKTRQAAFWSKNNARTQLEAALDPLGNNNLLNAHDFDQYIADSAAFLGLPPPAVAVDPPFTGQFAWSSISLGGIANPDFPPGVASGANGPLSRNPDAGEWSIFSTGIQTEVVLPGIALGLCEEVPDLAGVLFDLNAAAGLGVAPPAGGRAALFTNAGDRNTFCDGVRTVLIGSADAAAQVDCLIGTQDFPAGSGNITGLQNGFHIFQGAVPIYRYNADGTRTLIGGYGVSGDGAEQDDFVPFVALDETFKAQVRRGVAAPIGNAPREIRADNIAVQNVNLRYVVCPPAPFLSSNEQNGCEGR